MLAGNAAVEKAAAEGGYDVEVPFTPGRTDATRRSRRTSSRSPRSSRSVDGFRNYLGKGQRLPAEYLLVDRANLLTLTAPEMTVLVGGLRVLGANHQQSSLGVLTDRPGTLTNDFFVNLLDLGTTWTPDVRGRRDLRGPRRLGGGHLDRQPGRPGLRLELRAPGPGRGLRQRRRAGEVRPRLRRRLGQGHGPRPLRRLTSADSDADRRTTRSAESPLTTRRPGVTRADLLSRERRVVPSLRLGASADRRRRARRRCPTRLPARSASDPAAARLRTRRRCGRPRPSAAARRASTCSRATDTSTCMACRSGLAASRSCIQTVDPCPSGSTALSSDTGAYPSTARQKLDVDLVRPCGDGQLHLLHGRPVRDGAVCPSDRRDGSCQLDVMRLEQPEVAGQAHGHPIGRDREQRSRALETRDTGELSRQSRGLGERPDAEHRHRAAVQHHPVVDARPHRGRCASPARSSRPPPSGVIVSGGSAAAKVTWAP